MRAVRILLAILALIVAVPLCAQQLPDSPKPQADRPAFPAPNPAVPSRPIPPTGDKPQAEPAPSQQDQQQDPVKGPEDAPATTPAPTPNIKTVPQGGATKSAPSGTEG